LTSLVLPAATLVVPGSGTPRTLRQQLASPGEVSRLCQLMALGFEVDDSVQVIEVGDSGAVEVGGA
jgi:hypothetical protein